MGKKIQRTAPAPVVGWPPIRSSRRNLTSSSGSFSKPVSESSLDAAPSKLPAPSKKAVEVGGKGLFVKINMDGVPIGRKIDLNALDSYEKLSSAVDELFRGLLAGNLLKNYSSSCSVHINFNLSSPVCSCLQLKEIPQLVAF